MLAELWDEPPLLTIWTASKVEISTVARASLRSVRPFLFLMRISHRSSVVPNRATDDHPHATSDNRDDLRRDRPIQLPAASATAGSVASRVSVSSFGVLRRIFRVSSGVEVE